MGLLLALLAAAVFFAMPDEWRQRLAFPATAFMQRVLPATQALPDLGRVLLMVILPSLVVLLILRGLAEAGIGLLSVIPAALVVIVVFSDITQPHARARLIEQWQKRFPSPPSETDPVSSPALEVNTWEEQADWLTPEVTQNDALQAGRQTLLSDFLQDLFAPLFWLLLLGPAAALAYYSLRVLLRHSNESLHQAALSLQHLMDWIPVRVLSISFALAGNFTTTWACVRDLLLAPDLRAVDLLDEAAQAAEPIEWDDEVSDPVLALTLAITPLQALLQRSLVVWLVALALITLWPGY